MHILVYLATHVLVAWHDNRTMAHMRASMLQGRYKYFLQHNDGSQINKSASSLHEMPSILFLLAVQNQR